MGKFWLAVVLVVGCGKPKKLDGAIEVQFGDCAPPSVAFVSGPQPQPFEFGDIDKPQKSMFAGVGGVAPEESGWGTIGTGRIGHGAGTGTSGRRSARLPTVSIGQPNAQGDLDKAIIRRYIKRNIQKIQYCYEKQLLANANLQGTVQTQFFIAPDGNVTNATASGVDSEVASCVADVIKAIEFPKPKGGGGVQVNYPFTFRPAGSAPARTAEAPKDDPPPAEQHDKPDDGSDESGGTGTAMALDEGQMARQQAIEQARAAGILGSTALQGEGGEPALGPVPDYRAGTESPLQFAQDEFVECFRLQTKRYGVAVIDLESSKLTALGIDDAKFKSCVAKIKIQSSGPALRCSIAFGPMPLADVPAVDISKDAMSMNGAKLESIALVDHLRARVDAVLAKQTAVTLHGPLIIRPVADAPMKLVNEAVAAAIAAGDDPLLAVQKDGGWSLFREVDLPVVPVPVGSGYSWGAVKRRATTGEPDERVQLAILVSVDAIWVGLTRVNEFQKLDDVAALERALEAHKASAFFADRNDIEIAGDDDVTYGKVVAAIDRAVKAGFTNWTFATPRDLAAQFKQ